MQLTPNFIKSEFDSKDGAVMPSNILNNIKLLANNIQVIRDLAGPIKINSGYRSAAHNKSVGGVYNSQHVQGKAADLKPLKMSVKALYDLIIHLIKEKKIKDGGVGIYDSFVHYDIGGTGRRWDYRTKK